MTRHRVITKDGDGSWRKHVMELIQDGVGKVGDQVMVDGWSGVITEQDLLDSLQDRLKALESAKEKVETSSRDVDYLDEVISTIIPSQKGKRAQAAKEQFDVGHLVYAWHSHSPGMYNGRTGIIESIERAGPTCYVYLFPLYNSKDKCITPGRTQMFYLTDIRHDRRK